MKKCEKCNITINTKKKQCPVCFNELEGKLDNEGIIAYNYTKYTDNTPTSNFFLHRIFFFLTICIMSIVLFINMYTGFDVPWSLVVIVSLIYVWILVRHTIIGNRGSFEKIFFQFFGILGVILTSNYISGSESWFWNYVVPLASITTTTVLTFVLLINKKRSDFVLSFFVMALLMISISLTLILTNVDSFKLINYINLIYTGLFALGILILGSKSLKRALHKNLHL